MQSDMTDHSPEEYEPIEPTGGSDLEHVRDEAHRDEQRRQEDTERLTEERHDPRNPPEPFSGSEH
ncbi:hypothetical protein GCM10009661_36380 [Catellatospora chokoriensis]|uniref:Uncharacterized protein n=3 Tax=Micromonosporaceae TaxID=28056 RepID=A0A8J3KQ99_9ACTN|nr:hypothetical protein C8E86_2615 [Catellatospora citrea]GIF89174.1 hypothetical protein Cch02nite_26180 [Catellatospora chokoriensis]GIF99369.1 hypothetical protein Cci01nite_44630 [Catellatospora citrea]